MLVVRSALRFREIVRRSLAEARELVSLPVDVTVQFLLTVLRGFWGARHREKRGAARARAGCRVRAGRRASRGRRGSVPERRLARSSGGFSSSVPQTHREFIWWEVWSEFYVSRMKTQSPQRHLLENQPFPSRS